MEYIAYDFTNYFNPILIVEIVYGTTDRVRFCYHENIKKSEAGEKVRLITSTIRYNNKSEAYFVTKGVRHYLKNFARVNN